MLTNQMAAFDISADQAGRLRQGFNFEGMTRELLDVHLRMMQSRGDGASALSTPVTVIGIKAPNIKDAARTSRSQPYYLSRDEISCIFNRTATALSICMSEGLKEWHHGHFGGGAFSGNRPLNLVVLWVLSTCLTHYRHNRSDSPINIVYHMPFHVFYNEELKKDPSSASARLVRIAQKMYDDVKHCEKISDIVDTLYQGGCASSWMDQDLFIEHHQNFQERPDRSLWHPSDYHKTDADH